jgi:hypothetical protein
MSFLFQSVSFLVSFLRKHIVLMSSELVLSLLVFPTEKHWFKNHVTCVIFSYFMMIFCHTLLIFGTTQLIELRRRLGAPCNIHIINDDFVCSCLSKWHWVFGDQSTTAESWVLSRLLGGALWKNWNASTTFFCCKDCAIVHEAALILKLHTELVDRIFI